MSPVPRKKVPRKPMPSKFENLLLHFHDIEDTAYTYPLNNKLVLTSEDEPESNMVFGFVLNESMPDRLGRYMRRKNQPLSEKFNFMQMFDAGTSDFEFEEHHFTTFLMRKNGEKNPYPVFKFGEFEAYVCETDEEIKHVGENLAKHEPKMITLYSQLMVNRQTLTGLFNMRKVDWREADPDIVLNPSAYMRQKLAFPGSEPKFKT